jgi:hypothetical protein
MGTFLFWFVVLYDECWQFIGGFMPALKEKIKS